MPNWQRWKNIMKCSPFEEKRLVKWEPPYIVQPKYDGIRCRAIPVSNDRYLLLSSEENVIFSVPHINKMFTRLSPMLKGAELDGELYCHGMPFEGADPSISSITSRTKNLHKDYEKIQFHCFDIVNDKCQMQRTLDIENLIGKDPHLVIAPFFLCNNLSDIMEVFESLVRENYEGIIVRHKLNRYQRKRSTFVMKFKPKQEDKYEITGFEEEISINGEPKDTLGALICKSGDGNSFNVGTGFTDERRKELWEGRQLLIGQVARVKYQHITSGRKVPRFPVFIEIEVQT